MTEDTIKQEFIQLIESHEKFEQESKTRLDKLLSDYATISGENRTIQTSLESTQNQLKYIEEQNEQFKQNIQDYIQSLDEQRSLISEIETKLKVIERTSLVIRLIRKKKTVFACLLRIRRRNVQKSKMKNNEYKSNSMNIIKKLKIFNDRLPQF